MSGRKEYNVEFPVQAKPELVYNYLLDPSGLASWFAEDVNVNGETYDFIWEGSTEKAQLIQSKTNKLVKYQWIERDNEEFLTFQIEKDDLTGDTSIIVSDFDEENEIEEAKLMWESIIEQLKGTIGG